VAVDLGNAVGASGVKRRCLALRDLVDLAEHLRRTCLVDADIAIDQANGVEQPGDTEGCDLAGEYRLAKGCLHEGLSGEVVDLFGPVGAQQIDHRHFVEQITWDEPDLILYVCDSLEVDGAGASDHADHLVALSEQELGEVGAILSGDSCDESAFGHDCPSCYFE